MNRITRAGRGFAVATTTALAAATLAALPAPTAAHAAADTTEPAEATDTAEPSEPAAGAWPVISTGLNTVSPELAARASGALNVPGDAATVYATFDAPAELPILGNMALASLRIYESQTSDDTYRSFDVIYVGDGATAPDAAALNRRVIAKLIPDQTDWTASTGTEVTDGVTVNYSRLRNNDYQHPFGSLMVTSGTNSEGMFVMAVEVATDRPGPPVLPAIVAEHAAAPIAHFDEAGVPISEWNARLGIGGFAGLTWESHEWEVTAAASTTDGSEREALATALCTLLGETIELTDDYASCYESDGPGSVFVGTVADGGSFRVSFSGEFADLPDPEVGSVIVEEEPPFKEIDEAPVGTLAPVAPVPDTPPAISAGGWPIVATGQPAPSAELLATISEQIAAFGTAEDVYAHFDVPRAIPLLDDLVLARVEVSNSRIAGDRGGFTGEYELLFVTDSDLAPDAPALNRAIADAALPDRDSLPEDERYRETVGENERDGLTTYSLELSNYYADVQRLEISTSTTVDGIVEVEIDVSYVHDRGDSSVPNAPIPVPASISALAAQFEPALAGIGGELADWKTTIELDWGGRPITAWSVTYHVPGQDDLAPISTALCPIVGVEPTSEPDSFRCEASNELFASGRHVSYDEFTEVRVGGWVQLD